MYKLVILFKPLADWDEFEAAWPQFLHLVEKLPGLRHEATSRIDKTLYGEVQYTQIHELFFDSQKDAERALGSPEGQAAGKLLQRITSGQIGLFFADHKEDDLENIRRFRKDRFESE